MNVPLLVAGILSIAAAGIHGAGGQMWVVRKLTDLPPTRFGGASMTTTMVQVTWHIVTIAFLAFGVGLAACGGPVGGDACDGIGLTAALAFTAITVLTIAIAVRQMGTRRSLQTILVRHPAPLIFLLVSALAWWGTL